MELNKAVIFLILSLGTACIARAQNDGAVAPDTPPARPAEADFSSATPAARETPDRWKWLKHTGTCRLLTCQPSCLTQIGRS